MAKKKNPKKVDYWAEVSIDGLVKFPINLLWMPYDYQYKGIELLMSHEIIFQLFLFFFLLFLWTREPLNLKRLKIVQLHFFYLRNNIRMIQRSAHLNDDDMIHFFFFFVAIGASVVDSTAANMILQIKLCCQIRAKVTNVSHSSALVILRGYRWL